MPWQIPLLFAVFMGLSSQAIAAQLLLVEQPGCAPCRRFDLEVLPSYAQSTAGQTAPLRRIDVFRFWPEDLPEIMPTRFTPVFILVDRGEEVGRFYGYRTKGNFWFNLNRLLAKVS